MTWQEKYLSPYIQKEKLSLSKMLKFFHDFWILLIHSLSPHEFPREPNEELPDIESKDGKIYDVCLNIYNDANERIDKIENKAFNLIRYISALFAVFAFIFVQLADSFFFKIILLISIILLIISIIISFRCLNVKSIKTIFIPDIYDFESKEAKENFKKKKILKTYLNNSIYNHNVADNLADMLKAARYVLITAMFVGLIGSGTALSIQYFDTIKKESSKVDKNIFLNEVKNSLTTTQHTLDLLKTNIENQNIELKFKKISNEIDSLRIKLNFTQENYIQLKMKIDNINNELNLINKSISNK